jgi:Family of unknown function (DUF5989)
VSFVKELWMYLRTRRKYWLWPIIIITALLGLLIMLAQSAAVAPFLYTLF